MSAHTEVQIINQDGRPAFAVVPYNQWLELTGQADDSVQFPHEVVGYQVEQGLSLIAAWRKYRRLTQADLAARLGISQPALAQIEKPGANLQPKTLARVAHALGVTVAQLQE
ncbi:helix-turn-helix domain-containing protein [Sedimenticola hydrogenitrophicus]|uniref:helix-turn-helix domain-containing protein n=1 Tax=Sedimenticola hydrogenitrophicus TaxID=2967975 RepID=UPI0023B022C7|nr:helix-turn-helix transcriptional regulator [Sedimenticola hydrogenitrophicus]